VPDAHVKLFGRIVRTAAEKNEQIDTILAGVLPPEWPLARLDPVLRALLRAGGAEFTMRDGPPARVVINEYLDVAHGFFTGEEPRMANGLLDALARELRPKEFVGKDLPRKSSVAGQPPAMQHLNAPDAAGRVLAHRAAFRAACR